MTGRAQAAMRAGTCALGHNAPVSSPAPPTGAGRCPLEGAWSIARAVRDLRAGHDASFTGTASIAPAPAAPGELVWHEQGVLRSAVHRGPASRTMLIVPAGAAWQVLFADRRPFHPLDLGAGACEVVHPCGADHYTGRFRLKEPDSFEVRWRVRGPAKDLEIVSHYTRGVA
jgi:hypothetical protein